MNNKIIEEFQKQLNYELESELVYLVLAGEMATISKEASYFFIIQAHEERQHCMKFFKYLMDNGIAPKFKSGELPSFEKLSIQNAFKEGLNHEQFITDRISFLVELATEQDDIEAQEFLKWFVEEQVEEMETFEGILARFEAENMQNVLTELGKRQIKYQPGVEVIS